MSAIGEEEQDMLKRLIEVLYYLEVNEWPYMDFYGLIELEKMYNFLRESYVVNLMRTIVHLEILYKRPLSVCFRKTWKS